MQYVFYFSHENFITDLRKRISGINRFLKNHVNEKSDHRHFGIVLYKPNFIVDSCKRKSVRRFARMPEHSGHYLLGFFFFNSEKDEIGNLTILLDLGEKIDVKTEQDIEMFSLFASAQLDAVTFESGNNLISVRFEDKNLAQFLCDHFSNVLKQKEENICKKNRKKKNRKQKKEKRKKKNRKTKAS